MSRRVLITGGGAGIGAGLARRFAKEGDRIALCDADAGAVAQMQAEFPDAICVHADVTSETDMAAFLDRVETEWGGIDVVCANAGTGGSNYPLRGQKATLFEGGARAAAFASGTGLDEVAGTVSHALYSGVDWLPTIVHGIAGIDLAEAEHPKHPWQNKPMPLDGVDIWKSLSTGAPSPRTSALLYLNPL